MKNINIIFYFQNINSSISIFQKVENLAILKNINCNLIFVKEAQKIKHKLGLSFEILLISICSCTSEHELDKNGPILKALNVKV